MSKLVNRALDKCTINTTISQQKSGSYFTKEGIFSNDSPVKPSIHILGLLKIKVKEDFAFFKMTQAIHLQNLERKHQELFGLFLDIFNGYSTKVLH